MEEKQYRSYAVKNFGCIGLIAYCIFLGAVLQLLGFVILVVDEVLLYCYSVVQVWRNNCSLENVADAIRSLDPRKCGD